MEHLSCIILAFPKTTLRYLFRVCSHFFFHQMPQSANNTPGHCPMDFNKGTMGIISIIIYIIYLNLYSFWSSIREWNTNNSFASLKAVVLKVWTTWVRILWGCQKKMQISDFFPRPMKSESQVMESGDPNFPFSAQVIYVWLKVRNPPTHGARNVLPSSIQICESTHFRLF